MRPGSQVSSENARWRQQDTLGLQSHALRDMQLAILHKLPRIWTFAQMLQVGIIKPSFIGHFIDDFSDF